MRAGKQQKTSSWAPEWDDEQTQEVYKAFWQQVPIMPTCFPACQAAALLSKMIEWTTHLVSKPKEQHIRASWTSQPTRKLIRAHRAVRQASFDIKKQMRQVQQERAFAAWRAALLEAEGGDEADNEELEQRVRCKQRSREAVQLNSAAAVAMLLEPILAKQLKAGMRGDKEQWIEERSLQAAEAAAASPRPGA